MIEKLIRSCESWDTVADADTFFYHKYCIVLETKPVESEKIPIIMKIPTSKCAYMIDFYFEKISLTNFFSYRHIFCVECFQNASEETVEIFDDTTSSSM